MKRKLFLGLTMIELLVVVAFLSLLVLLGVFVYKRQIFKGYDARRKSDLNRIKIALEEYEKDYNCYPSSLPNCKDPDANFMKTYISKIPCDPRTKDNYRYQPDTSSTCSKWFWIFANLENSKDQQAIELGCVGNICGPDTNYGYNYYVASPNAPDPYRKPPIYGCFSGVCQPITYRDDGMPECQPNYTDPNCNGYCSAGNQCNPY